MTESIEQKETAEHLMANNTLDELRAIASARGIDSKGRKIDIVERLIAEPGAAAEPEPKEPARGDKDEEPPVDKAESKPAKKPAKKSTAKTDTPTGLKAPKVEAKKDGSRIATVKREMTYLDLAAEVGYVGSPRELAAFNGVRNGRMELHPGDKVTVPAPYDPRA